MSCEKLLFLPFIFMSCSMMAQTSTETIGKPVVIGKLAVAQFDFPKKMNWEDAKKACADLGKGWSLPTREELGILYEHRNEIGGFSTSYYWSSTEFDFGSAWGQNFWIGGQSTNSKNYAGYVRAVRAF